MEQNLGVEIRKRLENSPHWNGKTKENGSHIYGLLCPECGKPEGWAYKEKPFSINCNRKNKCGVSTKTLELFPDILQKIETEYPPTDSDPHKPATEFLKTRGLNGSLVGLKYYYWPERDQQGYIKTRKGCGGAVMFKVPRKIKGVKDAFAFNGRLFNPPNGQGKTHNQGKIGGCHWYHPKLKYDPSKPTYVTEGIIDALSLIEMGKQAIALLSAGQDPSKFNLSGFNKLVLAFDNDPAGHQATKKWKKAYPDADAIMPTKGDWNDLLVRYGSEKAKEILTADEDNYRFNADLVLVETANEYAQKYNEHHGTLPALFEFDGCYYCGEEKEGKNSNEKLVYAKYVANFTIKVDHFQVDNTNEEQPENRFFVKIKPKQGRAVSCVITATDLANPGAVTKALLERARVQWTGKKTTTDKLVKKIIESTAPVVRQLQSVGYDDLSDSYINRHFLINPDGEKINPDRKGFFKVSSREYIRPAQHATIKPEGSLEMVEFYELLSRAWPQRAPAANAWMIASWFVHLIKAQIGFFPFLSFYGDTQTGKTVLTRILNACQCFDEEGLPMSRVNTSKGEMRKIAQRSSLFKALLEGNSDNNRRFDTDSILPLYNDNPIQTRAMRSNDIQTVDIPFRSTLLFVQNVEPFKTKAQKERVISLHFKFEDITLDTTEAFNDLIGTDGTTLANFFLAVMRHRKEIEANWFEAYEQARKDLKPAIKDARLTDNHALILAYHRIFCDIFKIKSDIQSYIEQIGVLKHADCNYRQEDLADYFLDMVVNQDVDESIDHKKGKLLFHLGDTCRGLKVNGYQIPSIDSLQKALKEHPAFVKYNHAHKFLGVVKKAYVFDANVLGAD
jgi:hypothetical protein